MNLKKYLDLMIYLLKYVKDVNAPIFFNKNMLDVAVKNCIPTIVQLLLEMGAFPFKGDPREITYLHEAVCVDNVNLVRIFLKAGIEINSRDPLERTPLHCAALGTSIECLKEILSNNPNTNAIDRFGNTPINLGIKENENFTDEMLELLLECNADVNIADSEGNTPLHNMFFAEGLRSLQRSAILMEMNVKLNVKNKSGKTPLHLAIENRHGCSAAILIDNGADLNITDANGVTPLQRAAIDNQYGLCLYIIEYLAILEEVEDKSMGIENLRVIINDNIYKLHWDRCIMESRRLTLYSSEFNSGLFFWKNEKAMRLSRRKLVRDAMRIFPFSDFPLYGYKIRIVTCQILRRRAMEEIAEQYLTKMLSNVLHEECVKQIVMQFSDEQLRNFLDKYWNRHDRKKILTIYDEITRKVFMRPQKL